jgi:hypothetical protein
MDITKITSIDEMETLLTNQFAEKLPVGVFDRNPDKDTVMLDWNETFMPVVEKNQMIGLKKHYTNDDKRYIWLCFFEVIHSNEIKTAYRIMEASKIKESENPWLEKHTVPKVGLRDNHRTLYDNISKYKKDNSAKYYKNVFESYSNWKSTKEEVLFFDSAGFWTKSWTDFQTFKFSDYHLPFVIRANTEKNTIELVVNNNATNPTAKVDHFVHFYLKGVISELQFGSISLESHGYWVGKYKDASGHNDHRFGIARLQPRAIETITENENKRLREAHVSTTDDVDSSIIPKAKKRKTKKEKRKAAAETKAADDDAAKATAATTDRNTDDTVKLSEAETKATTATTDDDAAKATAATTDRNTDDTVKLSEAETKADIIMEVEDTEATKVNTIQSLAPFELNPSLSAEVSDKVTVAFHDKYGNTEDSILEGKRKNTTIINTFRTSQQTLQKEANIKILRETMKSKKPTTTDITIKDEIKGKFFLTDKDGNTELQASPEHPCIGKKPWKPPETHPADKVTKKWGIWSRL